MNVSFLRKGITMDAKSHGKTIQSVQRAIDILNCFSSAETALTLGEISIRLGLNKATAHGILNTLHNNGYVCQNLQGKYLLGHAIFDKAVLAESSRRNLCTTAAQQIMQNLSNQLHSNMILFLVENNNLRMAHMTTPTNCFFVVAKVSNETPMYATASGKLILSYADKDYLDYYLSHTELARITSHTITDAKRLKKELEKIRGIGYSKEMEELSLGVSAVSVPIFDANGRLYAALSATYMTADAPKDRRQLNSIVRKAAAGIQNSVLKS